MSEPGNGAAAGAASVGLSLSLAALLLIMVASQEQDWQPPTLASEAAPAAEQAVAPALDSVVLPPPPARTSLQPALPEPPAPTVEAPPPTPAPRLETTSPPPPPEPKPQAAAQPAPQAAPPTEIRPEPADETVAVTPETVREGRALLRLREVGEGPDIEIAWPAAASDRTRLYRLFNACFGMRTVIATDGRMYAPTGEAGVPWPFDGDRYSGFVRQPAGGASAVEHAQVAAIRLRHGLAGGQVLHLFPRTVDAILLGALHNIAGPDFGERGRIRARYEIAPAGVRITDISVDGRAADETIVLPYRSTRACRSAQQG